MLFTPTLIFERSGFDFSHNISGVTLESRRLWCHNDPWAQAGAEKGVFMEGNVLIGHDLLPTSSFLETDVYRKYVHRDDICQLLTCVIFGMESPAGPPLVLSHYRGLNDAPFGEAERERGKLLLPHLSRSVGVLFRLRNADLRVAASLAALDQLKSAVVLMDDAGRVSFANREAQRILAEEDGLRLRTLVNRGSRAALFADNLPEDQVALAKAVAEAIRPDVMATEHFSASVSVHRHSGRAPYVLHFSSLPQKNEFGLEADLPRAIVFIADPAEPMQFNRSLLRDTYELTAAEIRTAEHVVQGGTLKEVAKRIGVSENTVRTQLKQIYTKTGVDSRAKLIKLVFSVAAYPSRG